MGVLIRNPSTGGYVDSGNPMVRVQGQEVYRESVGLVYGRDGVYREAWTPGIPISALQVGDTVVDYGTTYYGVPIVWKVMEQNHPGDPVGSTALITEKIICLKAFDAKEASNSDSNRKQYGNNRYIHSNLRQWLNSTAAGGNWYQAQHSADAPPAQANLWDNASQRKSGKACSSKPYDSEAGFLTNFSAQLRNALLSVTKTVAKNTVTDGGGSEQVTDKIFLLSNTEVGLANENSVAEGSLYALFSAAAERQVKPTSQAVDDAWYKNSGFSATQNWYWWLRTPYASYSRNARCVSPDGTIHSDQAYAGCGSVRPACVVSNTLRLEKEKNADGHYVVKN